ncbi:MAG: hypothetical protein EBR82_75265, partial [Caulobacteraceae bacterium]|nr:hypothetical protein [Caulobacteraceae bacterium]
HGNNAHRHDFICHVCGIGRNVDGSMMLQLNPEMWVMTPKGEGLAFLVTDYGMDHNKIFTVMLQSGDILDFDIRDLRRTENPSFGVRAPEVPNPHYP